MRTLRAIRFLAAAFFALALATPAQMFVLSGMRSVPPGAGPSRTFLSPNGDFQLILEQVTAPMSPVPPARLTPHVAAYMSRRTGPSFEPLWNTIIKGGHIQLLQPDDIFVSDDGNFFLLSFRNGNDFTLHNKERSVPLNPGRVVEAPRLFFSISEKLAAIDTMGRQPIVRFWDRDRNSWFAFDTQDGSSIDFDSATAARWSEAMRLQIIDKLFAARQDHLRRKLAKVSDRLGKIANAALGTNAIPGVKEIHYEFLTLLRKPEDRRWIEDLIDIGDENRAFRNRYYLDAPDYYSVDNTDFVRARADWLLGVWDNKVRPDLTPARYFGEEGKLRRFTLGKIRGVVQFPMPINLVFKPNAAAFRLRLIPARNAGNADAEPEAEILHIIPNSPKLDEEPTDELAFAFNTVRPGEYKLKAIWDKRAPFTDTNSAGPGDYESSWSEPLTITAGSTISNIVLNCTNRVHGGETYYATDELIQSRAVETGEYARFTFVPDRYGGYDTFSRGAKFWILQTNTPSPANIASISRIGLRSWQYKPRQQMPRPDNLVVQFRKIPATDGKFVRAPAEPTILDEHGCAYRANYATESKQSVTFTFLNFPRAAKTFRLIGYVPVFNAAPTNAPLAFDYLITNLVATTPIPELPVTTLPTTLDLPAVKMHITQVSPNYSDIQVHTTFSEGVIPSLAWSIHESYAMDRHGNFIQPSHICLHEKNIRVIGTIKNHASNLPSIPFQLTVPRSTFQSD